MPPLNLSSPTMPHRARTAPAGVTAVLGPTNTGKTHYALERMMAYAGGMIGLPLRLLAREVYEKLVARRGERAVALVTGEEKIIPRAARYFVCTVEAMPLEREVPFLAIDEVQLAADPERGRVFTDRLLHARGQHETLFLGSDTMRPLLKRLIDDIDFVSRDRFSNLTFAGHKKVTRLPRRSAIVAFSADSVYSIAELVRRQRGGAAVVMGALSPRTRNAQAALYNEGEVDYLVATDAIGMGLNMDIDHVAFAGASKFDGRQSRRLLPAEVGQIAGRAGRHVRDGTWGTTADCRPLPDDLIEQVTNHRFDPVQALQWRNPTLDFRSLPALLRALEQKPPRPELVRARMDDDEDTLRRLTRRHDIHDRARGGAALKLLWEVCQVPDFRKVTPDQHAAMLGEIYLQLLDRGEIPSAFVMTQLKRLTRLDGDVDALSNRIAHVRTWTYLSHRAGWLENAPHWQDEARALEDALSDTLHEKLTQRFIDRRTSVLLKKLKDDAPLLAGVTDDGEVIVEGEFVGRLLGFQFILDPRAKGPHAKAVRYAALKALRPELAARAAALAAAGFHEFSLRDGGLIWWRQSVVAQLEKGPLPLRPNFRLVAVDHLPAQCLPRIEDRIRAFIADQVESLASPLVGLQKAANEVTEGADILGPGARGVAFRLIENFGAVSRRQIASEIKALEQDERAKLRKLGVRFGEYTIHIPSLLKPAPAQFLALLWALWDDQDLDNLTPPQAGATSVEFDETLPHAFYFASGYRPSGKRAVRIDMLERLAGEVRQAREAAGKEGFETTSRMMSLVGASGEDFEGILLSLGFKKATITKTVPKRTLSLKPKEERGPARPADATEGDAAEGEAAPADAATAAPGEVTIQVPTTQTPPDMAAPKVAADSEAPAADGATIPPSEEELPPSPQAAAVEASPKPTEETETVEVTVWHWSPPRAKREGERRGKPKGKRGDDAPTTSRERSDRGPGGKGKGKGQRGKPKDKAKDQGPRTFSSGPKRSGKEPDPDSPFAVLASLKDKK
ncbi:ATP-dependent DNA helicase [Parvularcula bermudensis HTCC2503]|uniref:ATP-dependent DNA helicase n=1 Tax=Parvularcula bermudensis (strain ATCC BAA-594 / HTCC2503 / KCTC 12087) TaxID=314260 RepID=E0TEI1_PARBH|nr:helicase-related protein [Parvularcula bermudensis]ADM10453.1 ATP-dependent DNA helicase [Parvularcula bermudensis HTCC2503]